MPAYSVHRPSVLRSGRLLVRVAAVSALLVASVSAAVVVTRASGSSSTASSPHTSGAPPLVSKPSSAKTVAKTHLAKTHVAKKAVVEPKVVHHAKKKASPLLTPSRTPVAVLNGGTSQGAAAATASRLRSYGYPVPVVGNAGRRDLPSAIEYTQGLGAAARALARKIGPVTYVTPFDGPTRNLSGARLLVIIGS
jgi:hypothetical protein